MTPIELALTQYGVAEIPGREHNPEILRYFRECGFNEKWITDETAWCSAFMNWIMKKTGRSYTSELTARSWLNIGESTSAPILGDIVVLWRDSIDSWKGHVGLYIRDNGSTHVYILGGNQKNKVQIRAYAKSRVLGYRKNPLVIK